MHGVMCDAFCGCTSRRHCGIKRIPEKGISIVSVAIGVYMRGSLREMSTFIRDLR
jgi:hypothetical protein